MEFIFFLIIGFVVYSNIKKSVGNLSNHSKNSGLSSTTDFLGNIDKIIQNAQQHIENKSSSSSDYSSSSSDYSSTKKFKPVKRKQVSKPKNISMSNIKSLETMDFKETSIEDNSSFDEVSLESLSFRESSMEKQVQKAVSLENESYSYNDDLSSSSECAPKKIPGLSNIISFDSDSLVKGFIFKEIFDRKEL